MLPSFPPATLTLVDGTIFRGYSTGTAGHTTGEVMFNTAITGHQEILTDPSYSRQIVTLMHPHIGNAGVNRGDVEVTKIYATGLIIEDLPILASNLRKEHTFPHHLKGEKAAAIVGIDTRKLTRIPHEKGAQNDCILVGGDNVQKAIDLSRPFPDLSGMDLVEVVPITESYEQTQTEWAPGRDYSKQEAPKHHVVTYDFGVELNIPYTLAERSCRMVVVSAQTSAADVLAHNSDGIFLSNGSGDPEPCDYAIAAAKEFLERRLPTSGICLDHQITGLVVGAKTLKMRTDHHGVNHPVKDLQDGRMVITSQDHGFAVDPKSLPANVRVTYVPLFDGTLQDFELTDHPALCFQDHSETPPGLYDITYLSDRFTAAMDIAKQ